MKSYILALLFNWILRTATQFVTISVQACQLFVVWLQKSFSNHETTQTRHQPAFETSFRERERERERHRIEGQRKGRDRNINTDKGI